jgi:hypothetical protein
LTFRHGFSPNLINDLTRTRRQPIQGKFFDLIFINLIIFFKGISTYLLIEVNNKDDTHHAERIELIDLFGNVLVNEKIQSNSTNPLLYSTLRKFQPPVHTFFFYIRVFRFFNFQKHKILSLVIWY